MSQQPMDAATSYEPVAPGLRAPNRKRWFIAVGIGAVVIAGIVTLALVLTSSGSFDMKGSITIVGSIDSGKYSDGHCHGSGGYSDIDSGTQVNVYDKSGDLVAVGSLADGKSLTGDSLECTFPFTVSDVPSGQILQVEVSHRGKSTVTEDQARKGGISLSLG